MAEHQHLPLPSAEISLPRRKRSGFPGAQERDYHIHAENLAESVSNVLRQFAETPRVGPVEPSLILKVDTTSYTAETDWAAADLQILATDADYKLIVLSNDPKLGSLQQRIGSYGEGPRENAKSPPHAGFVAPIESFSLLTPSERVGPLLKQHGLSNPDDLGADTTYAFDVELWEISPRHRRLKQIQDVVTLVEQGGGDVLDRYIGHSMTIMRVTGSGRLFQQIFSLTDVSQVDLPAAVDAEIGEILDLDLGDFPYIQVVSPGSPSITIIDSGVSSAHPLLQPAIGNCIAIPNHLSPDDTWGHGTKVAGIAVYGDLRSQIDAGELSPSVLLHSARVLNDHGKFPDDVLVNNQMREAISHFRENHGCKNIQCFSWRSSNYFSGRKS